MLDYKLKIGLVPDVRDLGDFETRKGIFEPAKGVENKNKVDSLHKRRTRPSRVVRIVDGGEEELPFTYENGRVVFRVKGLVLFDMFLIR